MKTKLLISYLFFCITFSAQVFQLQAQNLSELPPRSGDEQGLEIPENIKLQQDKDAIREAFDGWWNESRKTLDKRIDWYKEVKFGCFIHWGVSSPAGNEWNGTGGLGYSEHLMRTRKIPLSEYKSKLVNTFYPVNFNAEEWIKAASEAGMKYFIVTAKHHDGFAMYPSDAYPYDIRLTRFKRDPMRELRDAATKYGIKFGFYYSHAFDWEHPDAPGNDWDYQNPGGDKLLHGAEWWENYPQFLVNAEKYVYEKSIPQIKELLINYQPDIIWFDTPHKLPLYLNLKILKAIREVSPDIPVNGRLARMAGHNFGDYVNTGDRAAFFRQTPGVWEAIPTTNESYGYNKFDLTHKSPRHFVQLLASAAAKGGNILLNVGPMGDGTWDDRDINILKTIGSWMKIYGESIYGSERNPLSIQSWGEVTKKGNDLYLHVFHWPDDGKLIVGGFNAKVEDVCLVADAKKKLTYKKINDSDLEISLPNTALDTMNTVIKLTYSGTIQTNPVRLLSTSTPNQLLVFDAQLHGQGFAYGDGKQNREYVTNWKSSDQFLSWDFRLNNPKEFWITLKYNTESPADNGVVFIDVDGAKFQVNYPLVTNKTSNPSSTVVVGKIKLGKGQHQLKLLPGKYQGQQLMRPLSVSLLPTK